MKVLSDILHKAGILKEAAEAYSSGGYSVLVRNATTQRFETVASSAFVSDNIYTANGTLTGNRIVTLDAKQLVYRTNQSTLQNYTFTTGTPTGVSASVRPSSVILEGEYLLNANITPYNARVWGRNQSSSFRSLFVNQVFADITAESTGETNIFNQTFSTARGSVLDTSTTSTTNQMRGVASVVGHIHTGSAATTVNIVTNDQTAFTASIINYLATVNNTYAYKASSSVYALATQNTLVTNYYSFYSELFVGFPGSTPTSTLTNYYGVFLNTPSVRGNGTITNRWGVYAPDAAMNHYLNGNVVIGTTTLSGYKLDVTGVTRSTTRLMAGTFTPGGGLTADDKIVSDGLVRAAGINMRSPIVGDNIFIGLQSGGGDIQLWANNANVAQINAVGGGAGSVLRIGGYGYNPGAGQSGFRNSILIDNAISPTGNNTADYVMVHLNPQVDEKDIAGTYTSGSLRGFYYNPSITLLNTTTHFAFESTAGKIKVSDLSGTGSRMVVADSSGVLSTSALPTSTNIYNSDGTLTGNRTISTTSGYTLTINPATYFTNNVYASYVNGNSGQLDIGTWGTTNLRFINGLMSYDKNGTSFGYFGKFNINSNDGGYAMHISSATLGASAAIAWTYNSEFSSQILSSNLASHDLTLQLRDGGKFHMFSNGNTTITSGTPVNAGYKLDVQGTMRVSSDVTISVNGFNRSGSSGAYSVAIGTVTFPAQATQDNTVAYGALAIASGLDSTSIGNSATASFQSSIAIGKAAISTGIGGIAIGVGARASGSELVIGNRWHPITEIFFGTGSNRWSGNTQFTGDGGAYTINGSGAFGTDFAGGNMTIAGGKGTGTGTPGDVIISTATPTSSGTTLQTLTQRMWVKGDNGNVGIGASPNAAYKLDVAGTARFTSTLSGTNLTGVKIVADGNTTGSNSYTALDIDLINTNDAFNNKVLSLKHKGVEYVYFRADGPAANGVLRLANGASIDGATSVSAGGMTITGTTLTISAPGGQAGAINNQGTGGLNIQQSGVTALKIFDSTGNVKIQTGGTFTDNGYKLDVSGTGRFTNTLSVITTGTTNEVAVFKSTEPYITVEAAGGSNSASIFLRPSTSAQNATIQNRTGGGLEFYVNADYTNAKMTINGTTVNIRSLPTSASGLSSGDIWNDGGTLKVV